MISTTSERRHPRIEAPTVRLQIATRERFRRRFLRDLSQGGVYIRTQSVEPVGSEVRLELWPPGWDLPLRVRGEVVRVAIADDEAAGPTAVGMGVQFKEVGPKNRELLAELLSEYQSKAPRFEDDEELPEDHAELKRELRALRTRLGEARVLIASLCSDIEAMEDDDDSARPTTGPSDPHKRQHSVRNGENGLNIKKFEKPKSVMVSAGHQTNGKILEDLLRVSKLENAQLIEQLRLAEVRAVQAEQDFIELRGDLHRLVEEAHESARVETEKTLAQAKQRTDELASHLGRAEQALQQAHTTERELHEVLDLGSSRTEITSPKRSR